MIEMSGKEVLRSQVLAQVVEGKLDQASAASRLGISVRQVKRLKRRLVEEGVQGLVSRKRGKPSNRRIAPEVLARALKLIDAHYRDFGPTLACEKLAERHDIKLSVETVRQAMLGAGLWKARRGAGARIYRLRERRARRGELIQVDGSLHDWFEGRAPMCSLLVFIDDATGQLMALRFVDSETTLDYMSLLKAYILQHGLPAAIYSDRHSVFCVNKADEKRTGDEVTQFGRALQQLGIEGIQANSPQAKGRVERANQTLQDRLVKEMRLLGIDSQKQANEWLPQFIRSYNRRFTVSPGLESDAHIVYVGKSEALARILTVQLTRRLSANLSFQHLGLVYQIATEGQGLSLRGANVTLLTYPDGKREIRWQERSLSFTTMPKASRPPSIVDGKTINAAVDRAIQARRPPQPIGHPWKQKMPTPPGNPAAKAQFTHTKEAFLPAS